MENARKLHEFIEAVKEKTGKDKVNLVGRCEGCNIVLAYLAQYGSDSLKVIEMYVSCANGIDGLGAVFSGDLYLDAASLRRSYDSYITIDDNNLSTFLDATMDYLEVSYGFEGALALLKDWAPTLYDNIIIEAILSSYGTMPGIWSMIGEDYYEAAKKLIFAGVEDEYAGLIEKIDTYDREVRQKSEELLKEAERNGAKVGVFVKYGDYAYTFPICKEEKEYSDNTICVQNSSFGVTAAPLGEQLSDEYIASHDAAYISPDRVLDASTCLFPDTTWFARNSVHNDFDAYTNFIMSAFINSNGEMTVFDNPEYPQYATFVDGVLVPQQAPEQELVEKDDTPRFVLVFRNFFAFIKALFVYLTTLTGKA